MRGSRPSLSSEKPFVFNAIAACVALSGLASASAQSPTTAGASPNAPASHSTPAAGESTPTSLAEIVVSASGFEQEIKYAPASISVIQGEELRRKSFQNLTDAVRDVEGVVVNGSANESDISIRGMPGDYTLILVDGKRQSMRDARVNGNRGYEQSFIPPADAIERIEVVRGPMSSLYGSDAIGGVINIITRRVPQKWSGSLGVDTTVQQHSRFGNATQGQFSIGGPLKDDVLGLQIWGRHLNRQADDTARVEEGLSKARHNNLTARLSITPSKAQDILLEAGVDRLKNGSGPSQNWSDRAQDNNRDHAAVTHRGRWGWSSSEVSLSWERGSRWGMSDGSSATQDAFSLRKPETSNTVLDAKLITPLGNHLLSTGLQWHDTALKDWNEGLKDQVRRTYSATQKAIFVEDEWSVTDTLTLTGGLRLDHHEHYGTHYSPRVYANWQASENWTIKGGISRGFKTPEIRAITPGYAYLRRNRFVMLGNPDLQPETSTNYEIGALWSSSDNRMSGGVTVFYNDFSNKLNTITTTNRWNGFIVMDRVNVDKARIAGLESHARYQISPTLGVKANYTYLNSKQKSGANEGAPLTLTPKHVANLRLDWQSSAKLLLWASANYYGQEYGASITAQTAPSYTLADIGLSYKATESITLNAALQNFTNRQLDNATFGKTTQGRRVWLGVNTNF